jgi:hypothetical protein
LETKVNALSSLQNELASLRGEIGSLSADQPDVAALQSRLDGLQTQVEGLAAEVEAMSADAAAGAVAPEEHAEDPFALSVAQYFMDTAGFHGMAETISETQQVDPAYLGTVNRVHKVLVSTPWPEELKEQGQAFVGLLEDFAAALEADNGEQAVELSDQVHDAQHELSHAIDAWMGTAGEHVH